MKISEHKFDRLDGLLAQRPISQLIDESMMVWNQIEVLEVKIPKKFPGLLTTPSVGESLCGKNSQTKIYKPE